jgi:F0F1-type ATP synthase membrane subunit a
MWWKLSLLVIVTAVLISAVIPIRTHAVRIDPSNPPPRPSLWQMVGSMHLTPTSALLITFSLAIAILIGVKIVRASDE